MRIPILLTAPTLSDDVYRFVWDGRVQSAGINPYLYSPSDPALADLRDEQHARINHPAVRTIYPLLSETVFRFANRISETPLGQKIAFATIDLGAIAALLWLLALMGKPAAWAALYAWSPVSVVEFAGSGHNDSLMILFLVLALIAFERKKEGLTALSLAAATMSKWIPVIVVPWLIVQRRWRALALYSAACAVMMIPFVTGVMNRIPSVPSASDWIFNASVYSGVATVVTDATLRKILIAPVLILFSVWWARRQANLSRYLYGVTLVLLLLGPVVHPWYLSWILPYASVIGSVTCFVWAWAASLSYVVQIRYAEGGVWHLPGWVPVVEYAVVFGTLLGVGLRRMRRPTVQRAALSPVPKPVVSVVIPALNEEQAIGLVISSFLPGLVREVIVVDNGSTDNTAAVARAAGARVIQEPVRGYGRAVKRGLDAVSPESDVVVIADGDRADFPEDLPVLLDPIARGEAHMVIGSRTKAALPGSLMPQQRFGNWLTCGLIRFLYGHRYSDMGPFRALRRDALTAMKMGDENFGWNVEMQVKALQLGFAVKEVPVRYRPRIGQSKISGTLSGSFHAGRIILWSIYDYTFRRPAG